jgi:hypothetical protein
MGKVILKPQELIRQLGLICLSQRKNTTHQAVYDNAHELKVIIFNKHDFVLRKNKLKSKWQCDFSREWSKKEEMTP